MKNLRKWTIAIALALFTLCSFQVSPSTAAEPNEVLQPTPLTNVEDGKALYDPLSRFITSELELSDEDASAMTEETIYEVDLGNYPKGYTRQFLTFVFNYDWIELVLVASNSDASNLKLLNRAVSSDDGDMFLNTAKLEFSTEKNHIFVWTQSPYSAYESNVDLEWAGDTFYVTSHQFSDPSQQYFDEKARLIKAKDIQGLIELQADYPLYPSFYDGYFTLAAPALNLAHQKALTVQNKSIKSAIKYLEYGLDQYGEAFDLTEYKSGTLTKSNIVSAPDNYYSKARLSLNTYVGILNDYGYFLSVAGRNQEAKPILANIIKLVPNRTVAYLNLADVEWTLGQKSAAKTHYQQYWKLLGTKAASIAPKRVKDRMK